MAQKKDVSSHQRLLVEQAATIRGAIITLYAQVEFLLGDMVMRCSRLPEYAFIADKFPYRLEKRVMKVREIVDHPGPFSKYKAEVEALVDGLSPYEEIRHMMAHGLVMIRTTPDGDHDVIYRLWRSGKGGIAEYGTMVTTVEQLALASTQIGRFTHEFIQTWRRMYMENDLEPAI